MLVFAMKYILNQGYTFLPANFCNDFLNQRCNEKCNWKRRAKTDGERSHPNEQKVRHKANVHH
jgi:hypothetical protein